MRDRHPYSPNRMRPLKRISAVACLTLLAVTCTSFAYRVPVPLGLDLFAPEPEDNPHTRERVELGRRLFFDTRLSADGSRSCSSCHRPGYAFSDTIAISRGTYDRKGVRNAPTLLNVGYGSSFFWDGRASTLESQVLLPIQDTLELGLALPDLEARLRANAGYRRAFQRAFGADASAPNVARALATYLRTLRSGNSPFDRYRHGDPSALSPRARDGLALFNGKARCATCHIGPTLSDGDFHNTGVAWRGGTLRDRGRAVVTRRGEDAGAFKTPTLRNVEFTAPYMHDGSIPTLPEVIAFYDSGGRHNPTLSPLVRPLDLTADERGALLELLRAFTGVR